MTARPGSLRRGRGKGRQPSSLAGTGVGGAGGDMLPSPVSLNSKRELRQAGREKAAGGCAIPQGREGERLGLPTAIARA